MIIKTAVYQQGAVKPDQYPTDSLPEIALAGRSNVGKSSLINVLVNRKKLARTSGQPGKTQILNFFLINDAFYLVDLPGYGFARVPKSVKMQWGKMIDQYLVNRGNLVGVIQLLDIRHPPSKEDIQMFEWLKTYQKQIIIVCTKADKISKGRWPSHLKVIKQDLNLRPGDIVIPCSATNGTGIEELRKTIGDLVG
jgi:GTP-binding protein